MEPPERTWARAGRSGSRIVGVGIGLAAFVGFVMLPFLIPAAFYVVVNLYALTKGTTFSAEMVNEGVLLSLLMLSVASFPVGASVLLALLGRALSPERRRP